MYIVLGQVTYYRGDAAEILNDHVISNGIYSPDLRISRGLE